MTKMMHKNAEAEISFIIMALLSKSMQARFPGGLAEMPIKHVLTVMKDKMIDLKQTKN